MKTLIYTCRGGPLDGITQGPFPPPDAPKLNGAGGLDDATREKWLSDPFTLCRAYARRGKRLVGPAQGRYDIREEADGFVAIHVPSEDDVYFPAVVLAPVAPGQVVLNAPPAPKAVSTLDLS